MNEEKINELQGLKGGLDAAYLSHKNFCKHAIYLNFLSCFSCS
jgi:hypothetical protein